MPNHWKKLAATIVLGIIFGCGDRGLKTSLNGEAHLEKSQSSQNVVLAPGIEVSGVASDTTSATSGSDTAGAAQTALPDTTLPETTATREGYAPDQDGTCQFDGWFTVFSYTGDDITRNPDRFVDGGPRAGSFRYFGFKTLSFPSDSENLEVYFSRIQWSGYTVTVRENIQSLNPPAGLSVAGSGDFSWNSGTTPETISSWFKNGEGNLYALINIDQVSSNYYVRMKLHGSYQASECSDNLDDLGAGETKPAEGSSGRFIP